MLALPSLSLFSPANTKQTNWTTTWTTLYHRELHIFCKIDGAIEK